MTMDAQAAVAALVAAKDIEALETAIAQSGFLDNTPGEDRQKLRGEGWAGRKREGRARLGASRSPGRLVALRHSVSPGSHACVNAQRRARG